VGLNLLVELDRAPIGSQSVHADRFSVIRTIDTGSWLGRPYQGRGLGTEMRAAVLAFAFDGLGAEVAESAAFPDNAASNRVSRKLGYEENGRGRLAPEGVARETQRFRMTVDSWRSDRDPRSPSRASRRAGRCSGPEGFAASERPRSAERPRPA
jgi:RimJ/RimL family protein N-acetyltransferase